MKQSAESFFIADPISFIARGTTFYCKSALLYCENRDDITWTVENDFWESPRWVLTSLRKTPTRHFLS